MHRLLFVSSTSLKLGILWRNILLLLWFWFSNRAPLLARPGRSMSNLMETDSPLSVVWIIISGDSVLVDQDLVCSTTSWQAFGFSGWVLRGKQHANIALRCLIPALGYIRLFSNMLTGSIPSKLYECKAPTVLHLYRIDPLSKWKASSSCQFPSWSMAVDWTIIEWLRPVLDWCVLVLCGVYLMATILVNGNYSYIRRYRWVGDTGNRSTVTIWCSEEYINTNM